MAVSVKNFIAFRSGPVIPLETKTIKNGLFSDFSHIRKFLFSYVFLNSCYDVMHKVQTVGHSCFRN